VSKICIALANWFEKMSISIRKSLSQKKHNKFIKKYGLKEACEDVPRFNEYNPYQCTNLYMADELISKGIITRDKKLLDVGCGSGILLSYLYTCGFSNLVGVEIDEENAALARENLERVGLRDANILCQDILNGEIDDSVDAVYLFNPFQHKETYDTLISKIEKSFNRAPREITVILLCPTLASYDAFRQSRLLYEWGSVTSPYQFCNKCVRYSIYKTEKTV
jgi:SAM-dependent methyltransferase